MNEPSYTRAVKYGAAVLAVIVALALTLSTSLKIGAPFLLLIAAVTASTWFGGLGPGLLSVLLSIAGVLYLVLPAGQGFDQTARIVVFIATTLIVFLLTSERERARESARRQAQRHATVAKLGQSALASVPLPALFEQATRFVCDTLAVDYTAILEVLPDRQSLLLKAGWGWNPETVGSVTPVADTDLDAGLTLASQEPFVIRDLRTETRFRAPQVLLDHSVVSGLAVPIQGAEHPYGILAAFARRARSFAGDEIDFLQSVANVLAEAIRRENTESALRSSEQQFKSLVDSMEDTVFTLDREQRHVSIHGRWLQKNGFSSTDYLGKTPRQILGHEAGAVHEAANARALQGESVLYDWSIQTANGLQFYQTSLSPLRSDSGEITGIVGANRQITALKRAEQALANAKGLLETIFSSTDLALAYLDANFNYIRVNRAYAEMAEHEPEFYAGKNHFTLYPNDENESIFQRVLDTGEAYAALAAPFDHAEGAQSGARYWDWSLQPTRNDQGSVTGLVISLVDVTERIRAEKAYRETAERMRHVVESAPIWLWTVNADGVYTLVEGSLASRLGLTPDRLLGQSIWQQTRNRPEVQALLTRAFEGESVAAEQTWSGHFLECQVWPIRSDGHVVGLTGIAWDITERRQAEERLRELAREMILLQEEDRRQIARTLNDDAGQVLAAVKMSFESIQADMPYDLSLLQYRIGSAASQIAEILGQIRALAQVLRPAALDTIGLNATLKDYCSNLAQSNTLTVDYSGQDVGLLPDVVSISLYRALQEVVTNAAKHARATRIGVKLIKAAGQIGLQVEYNGQGFDPITEVPGPQGRRGTGLAALQERIKLLGGCLEVQSHPGTDTIVNLNLPLLNQEDLKQPHLTR